MSEYQFYEFQAIDRPLTKQEMAELRALSTRATITPAQFVNVYNFGSFKGDPLTLMERYFDAFVYVANWGTHEFMVRLPRTLLAPQTAAPYCVAEGAACHVKGDHVILAFSSQNDEGDWEETGEEWLPSLVTLRSDLASGDLRPLYVAWLGCARSDMLDEDAVEPPVPPGLNTLSAPLSALAQFLRVDDDLLQVAAAASDSASLAGASLAGAALAGPSPGDLERVIRALSPAEKDALLLRAAQGGAPHLRAELLQRWRQAQGETGVLAQSGRRRTAGQLLASAEERAERRRREAAERDARERARQQRQQAAARAQYLDELAPRVDQVWRQVETLVEAKRPAEYDQAVRLLRDLRDVAGRTGANASFTTRLAAFRAQHARKPALVARLDRAQL